MSEVYFLTQYVVEEGTVVVVALKPLLQRWPTLNTTERWKYVNGGNTTSEQLIKNSGWAPLAIHYRRKYQARL